MKKLLPILAMALFVIFIKNINATNDCLKNPVITGWVFNDKGC